MRSEALAANLASLNEELAGTATRLLVVSKTQTAADIRALYHAGQRDFGENRVQELLQKDGELADLPELRWHLIGHLQSNKIPKLNSLSRLVAIHSVDDGELVEKLKTVLRLPRPVGLFLQLNTSREDEKSGFDDEVKLMDAARSLSGVGSPCYLQGLMTMGTIRTDDVAGEARRCFQALLESRDKLMKTLGFSGLQTSMGMSGDYLIARDMGSDWVRVGSKIFKVPAAR